MMMSEGQAKEMNKQLKRIADALERAYPEQEVKNEEFSETTNALDALESIQQREALIRKFKNEKSVKFMNDLFETDDWVGDKERFYKEREEKGKKDK